MNTITKICLLFCACLFIACQSESGSDNTKTVEIKAGFQKVDSASSGLNFTNNLDEENLKSVFDYINLFTGSGVAIGDINNDGLQDVYFTSNRSSNKLYLNKGNLQFEDITVSSGTSTTGWSTGVTMADVNNDGWLDIYVCKSYHDNPAERRNQLFVNNKNGTFSDYTMPLKIADENYSIGASFFDYDKDGDLDLFVANHPRYRLIDLAIHYNYWKNPIPEFSSRLYRNDRNGFTEVTKEAGILSYGFSLGVTTTDYDVDGYPDIFVTIDHDEPDLVFHNNGNGTFSQALDETLQQTSRSSMGIDAGDLNHDKYPDIVVAEMLSEDHYREKVNMSMQSVDRFNYLVDTLKYKYYQMHNFLYLNNGNKTFSDVSQLAGVHKSDWSWASLFMDYNNDGWQDLFFANGLYKEIFNKDKMNVVDSLMIVYKDDTEKRLEIAMEHQMNSPQSKIKNYLFQNNGNLNFTNVASEIGLDDKTISTGAAYGDLDNDGDLDLIVTNIGEEAILYENQINSQANYLRVQFNKAPISSLGSTVNIYYGDDMQSRELYTTRGFQSSCEPIIHFGLGNVSKIDKVEINWSIGKTQVLNNVDANQTLLVNFEDATQNTSYENNDIAIVKTIPANSMGINYAQKENYYNDYLDQVLLPHKLSEYGPFTSVGDVNGDNLDDIYIGSPHQQASQLYIQQSNGRFAASSTSTFNNDKKFEDGQSTFVDVDNDNDLDLVVASTGYEFENNSPLYQARLYINDGNGNFTKSKNGFPEFNNSASCVKAADFDEDGDMDIFIGGRLTPKQYPKSGTSGLFVNNGDGTFTNKISEIAPELEKAGMIRDAEWTDLNGDNKLDLMVVGEWMPISFWINSNNTFKNETAAYFSTLEKGWWNSIDKADIDGNGLEDYVIGNLGLNYKYKASRDKPFVVYAKDFDESGTQDIVLGCYYGDKMYPLRGKSCSSEQIPGLVEKFPSYEEFAIADIHQVYGEELDSSLNYEVNQFQSIVLFQDSKGKYSVKPLPREAQVSPVNGSIFKDFNNDGQLDILVAGNLYQSEIETGRADSGTGRIFINQGQQNFKALSVLESGLYLPGDVKSLSPFKSNGKEYVLVANNKSNCQIIEL